MNDFVAVLGIVSTFCAIMFGYTTFIRNKKSDASQNGAQNGTVLTEIGYIKSGVDDIKRKQERQEEKQESQHIEVISRLTSVEESAKQAHKRIDGLRGISD
ncbi:hypothetical protein DSECCO2_378870 [anaerobic digester metagenome]